MMASGPPSGGAASAFESIFASYSERALTLRKDRPYAIAGLELRLADLYKTKISHGIVHCCFRKSLLWQRSGTERMKKISDPEVEMVPSWSWMKYEGKIRYGDIPTVNTSWNEDIKPPWISQQCMLAAPVGRILQDYHIELNTCKIKDIKDRLVGCVIFDGEDEVDIGCLGYVVIACYKPHGWTEFSKDTWRNFANISGNGSLEQGNLSYVLVVSHETREEGYKEEVCHRLGVAVIQSECLSFTEPPQTLWVI
jgi:hypothetical protein